MGFEKPTTKYIDVKLQKDLHDNEDICPTCGGLGLMIANNPYGLSNDPDKTFSNLFPYKHQSLTFCKDCFNGVVKRCKLCGGIIPKGRTKCNCEKQEALDKIVEQKKKKEEFDNAPIAPREIEENCKCFFSESCPINDGYFFEWEDFFEAWHEYCSDISEEDRPEYVWITDVVNMSIDAVDIIENATEDLYEDATDNISKEKVKELQDLLDEWCRTCGVGETYYESHKYKVRIPWEQYE